MEKASESSHPCLAFLMDSNQTDPWLLISQGKNLENHAFYSISKNELKTNTSDFSNKQISSTSYDGWLAMIDVEKLPLDCCLLNAITKEKIQLPCIDDVEPDQRSWSYKCILSKPPTDPGCRVLFLPAHGGSGSIQSCRLGDEKFIRRSKSFGRDYFMTATNFNGKIYAWMIGSWGLVEVDFVGEEIILKPFVNEAGQPCQIPSPPSTLSFFGDYLVDSCGELLLVRMMCYTHSVEVAYFRIFKVDILEKECSELRSIGNRTIFLGGCDAMSLLCGEDKSRLKKNSIYYTWDNRYLYMYDIEDRSKTLFQLCPIKKGTKSLMSWVMI